MPCEHFPLLIYGTFYVAFVTTVLMKSVSKLYEVEVVMLSTNWFHRTRLMIKKYMSPWLEIVRKCEK